MTIVPLLTARKGRRELFFCVEDHGGAESKPQIRNCETWPSVCRTQYVPGESGKLSKVWISSSALGRDTAVSVGWKTRRSSPASGRCRYRCRGVRRSLRSSAEAATRSSGEAFALPLVSLAEFCRRISLTANNNRAIASPVRKREDFIKVANVEAHENFRSARAEHAFSKTSGRSKLDSGFKEKQNSEDDLPVPPGLEARGSLLIQRGLGLSLFELKEGSSCCRDLEFRHC